MTDCDLITVATWESCRHCAHEGMQLSSRRGLLVQPQVCASTLSWWLIPAKLTSYITTCTGFPVPMVEPLSCLARHSMWRYHNIRCLLLNLGSFAAD